MLQKPPALIKRRQESHSRRLITIHRSVDYGELEAAGHGQGRREEALRIGAWADLEEPPTTSKQVYGVVNTIRHMLNDRMFRWNIPRDADQGTIAAA